MENTWVMTSWVWVPLGLSFFGGLFFIPLCILRVFYVYVCIIGQGKFQERWHNFDPDSAPWHGACRGASNPEGPSTSDTKISQMGTRLRVWFWLGGAIGAYRGRGWKYQCILSSTETSIMLISLPHSIIFMWWKRSPRSAFLILQKHHITRGMSCNQFMARRQRTKWTGATEKVTCLFCHQEKIWIKK